jgi:hypothetical protein
VRPVDLGRGRASRSQRPPLPLCSWLTPTGSADRRDPLEVNSTAPWSPRGDHKDEWKGAQLWD